MRYIILVCMFVFSCAPENLDPLGLFDRVTTYRADWGDPHAMQLHMDESVDKTPYQNGSLEKYFDALGNYEGQTLFFVASTMPIFSDESLSQSVIFLCTEYETRYSLEKFIFLTRENGTTKISTHEFIRVDELEGPYSSLDDYCRRVAEETPLPQLLEA